MAECGSATSLHSSGFCPEIPFLKDSDVMRRVARRDIRQRSHCKRIIAGDSGTQPCVFGQIAKEAESRFPDAEKLLAMRRPRNSIGVGAVGGEILIKTRKRSREAARKPEGAGDKKAFAIVNVAQELANAPFIGSVAVKRFVFADCDEEPG